MGFTLFALTRILGWSNVARLRYYYSEGARTPLRVCGKCLTEHRTCLGRRSWLADVTVGLLVVLRVGVEHL